MKRLTSSFAVMAALSLFAWISLSPVPALAEEAEDDGWDFKWKNGFKLNSPDGDFKLSFGGRIHLDFVFPDPDPAVESLLGPVEDESDIRRARIGFSGTLYERVEFKIEYDFAGGDADPTDVYVGIKGTPIGNLRVGHFFEPFSLEQHTSSKYITFLERALPNAFSPARNLGVMLFDTALDKRLAWAVGAFRESDGFSRASGDGKLNLTGRVFGLPIFEDGGRRLLHLGLAYSKKDLGDDAFRFRQRPEVSLIRRFVDTGGLANDGIDLTGFEVALNAGSFHAQGEYMQADVDSPALGDPSFDGYYVQAGYFLTGEHRPYLQGRGGFGRVTPRNIFGREGGRGAWEIAARYSTLDLVDAALSGGELDNFTLAINWYLNPVTRAQLNYVSADRKDVGDSDFLLFRIAIEF